MLFKKQTNKKTPNKKEQLSANTGNYMGMPHLSEQNLICISFSLTGSSGFALQNTEVPETGQITHGKVISIYSLEEPLSDALGQWIIPEKPSKWVIWLAAICATTDEQTLIFRFHQFLWLCHINVFKS